MDTQRAAMPLELLAEADLRLAALFRRQNQPEVAVPVLVEVIKLMTPAQPQGRQAYQSLIELGFVETEFRASTAGRPTEPLCQHLTNFSLAQPAPMVQPQAVETAIQQDDSRCSMSRWRTSPAEVIICR